MSFWREPPSRVCRLTQVGQAASWGPNYAPAESARSLRTEKRRWSPEPPARTAPERSGSCGTMVTKGLVARMASASCWWVRENCSSSSPDQAGCRTGSLAAKAGRSAGPPAGTTPELWLTPQTGSDGPVAWRHTPGPGPSPLGPRTGPVSLRSKPTAPRRLVRAANAEQHAARA